MSQNDIVKALESHKNGECYKCPYEHLPNCLNILCDNAVSFIKEVVPETINKIKKRANCDSYSCLISGEIKETYSISGKALDEIEKELSGGKS